MFVTRSMDLGMEIKLNPIYMEMVLFFVSNCPKFNFIYTCTYIWLLKIFMI